MTKPREKTREELQAEIEDGKKKIRQFENREKVLRQKLSQEERRTRSHRLIVRGAVFESIVPEAKNMSDEEAAALLRFALTSELVLIGVQEELLRFAYKLTANREEANDLLQETSLKALDNEEKYVPDTNFKGWMYTIMRNIFINNYRKIVRDQTFVDQTDNLYHLNLPQDSGFESTEGAYDLKEMHRIVNALPKEYKVPFSMHVSGFKYREIAEKLDLPLGTVKSRIFFTRQRLQQELKDFV